VVLVHGFGETGDMWSPNGRSGSRRTTPSSRPDLRGNGPCPRTPPAATTSGRRPVTSAPSSTSSAIDRAEIVGHDIGVMVRVCLRGRAYPDKTSRLVVIDFADTRHPAVEPDRAPALRCGTSTSAARTPSAWFAGRERIYLDRFWNEFAGDPSKIDEANPPPLRRDLRQARRDAFRVRPVPRDRPEGRGRQPQGDGDEGWRCQCSPSAPRRPSGPNVGGRHAQRGDETCRKSSCRTPATG